MNEELYKLFEQIQHAERVLAQVKGELYGPMAYLTEQTENLHAMKQAYVTDELLSHTYESMRRLRWSLEAQLQSKDGAA